MIKEKISPLLEQILRSLMRVWTIRPLLCFHKHKESNCWLFLLPIKAMFLFVGIKIFLLVKNNRSKIFQKCLITKVVGLKKISNRILNKNSILLVPMESKLSNHPIS